MALPQAPCEPPAMLVYLLRHADAVMASAELSDESRFLSDRGRADARAIGAALVHLHIEPTAIVTSPLVRAVQTAELVAAAFPSPPRVSIDEQLAPGRSTLRLVAELPTRRGVLLVGHEPSISELAAVLTHRRDVSAFEKSQLLRIEEGEARWTMMPGDSELRPLRR